MSTSEGVDAGGTMRELIDSLTKDMPIEKARLERLLKTNEELFLKEAVLLEEIEGYENKIDVLTDRVLRQSKLIEQTLDNWYKEGGR